MPAQDRLHPAVVRALIKDGWKIDREQVELIMPSRRLWVDIKAIKSSDQSVILIEVKGFEARSQVEYLANAIGKYSLYRSILHYLEIEMPLYLAVPIRAYNGILSEEVGQNALQEAQVKLLVFDPELEEIVRWID